jgi:hypothetical protein
VKSQRIQIVTCLASLVVTACTPDPEDAAAPILLFSGTGTSPNDVEAVKAVLRDSHLKYFTVNSAQLNGMSESQLLAHRLMIIPGGNYIKMGKGLSPAAAANVRNAVQGGLKLPGNLCRRASGRKCRRQWSESDGGRAVRFLRGSESRYPQGRLSRLPVSAPPRSSTTGRMARSLLAGVRWWESIPMEPPQSLKEPSAKAG